MRNATLLNIHWRYALANVFEKPNIMYDFEHPAHIKLREIGKEVTSRVQPKGIVVFSAHWQGGKDHVEVNTEEVTDLIYEYVLGLVDTRAQ